MDLIFTKSSLKSRKRGQWKPLLNKCGVYAFTDSNKILYIGRSGNLYRRLISHYSQGGICHAFDWDKIGVIFCEDHRRVEKELIDEYQPTYNGKLTSKFYY